jgi:type IV secretory pathway VirB10-like protein
MGIQGKVPKGGEKNNMKKMISLFVCLLFATSVLVAAGCSKKEEPAKPAAEPAKPAEQVKPAEPEKKAEEAKPAETKPEAKPEEKAPEKK